MKTNLNRPYTKNTGSFSGQYSALEEFALRHSHPRKIIFDSLGFLWAIYFLWHFRWGDAIWILLASSALGMISVRGVKPELMAETTLGKLALLHLNPINLSTQVIGLGLLAYGIWGHSTPLTLVGVSVVALGHTFGWDLVDARFARTKDSKDHAA